MILYKCEEINSYTNNGEKNGKKIKIDGGLYKYKKFTIERIEDHLHWNIGSYVNGEFEWHDAADTLKDAIAFIDRTY